MAFAAKDGSKHTNMDTMKRSDAQHMAKTPVQAPSTEDAGDGQPEDVHAVVDQHGPASEVHVMHQEGKHSLHSVHGDGHTHQSEHMSAGEAHDAGKCLSGDCDCGGM